MVLYVLLHQQPNSLVSANFIAKDEKLVRFLQRIHKLKTSLSISMRIFKRETGNSTF